MPNPTHHTTPSAPLPGWLPAVAGIVGVVLCLGLAITVRSFDLYTATARKPGIAVWMHTPFVSPGDTMIAEVAVYGGSRAAIRAITVRGEGIRLDVEGPGKDWGMVIRTKTAEVGQAAQTLHIPISDSAQVGTSVLHFAATSTEAVTEGSSFRDEDTAHGIEIPIEIRTPGDRAMAKVLGAFRGLGTLALAMALFRFLWHPVARFFRKADEGGSKSSQSLGQSLVALVIGVLMLYCLGGIVLFAHPLRWATGLVGDGWTALAVLVWIVAPPYVGRRLAGPLPPPPRPAILRPIEAMAPEPAGGYRDAPAPDRPRKAKVQALFDAIAKTPGVRVKRFDDIVKAGARTKRVLRRIEVHCKNPRAMVTVEAKGKEVGAGELTMMLDDVILAASVARAMCHVLGPFEMEIDGIPIAIDRRTSVAQILTTWQQGIVARARALIAPVSAMRAGSSDEA
jgi:hypothetical protein